eukprot:365019-Chlamydomonas_euryale.AAC.24
MDSCTVGQAEGYQTSKISCSLQPATRASTTSYPSTPPSASTAPSALMAFPTSLAPSLPFLPTYLPPIHIKLQTNWHIPQN